MKHHYGDIKRTKGADGDAVDVFIGDKPESGKVFVVDQVDARGNFDEHKVMLGFDNKPQAITAYRANYDKGWKVGPVKQMSIGEFKSWLKNSDTSKPISGKVEPKAANMKSIKTAMPKQDNKGSSGLESLPKFKATHKRADGTLTMEVDGQFIDEFGTRHGENGVKPLEDPKQKTELNEPQGEKLTVKGVALAEKTEQKIEDFGEKIEGAKKETYSFSESISQEADISALPLSKAFPLPDFVKLVNEGVEPDAVALLAWLRAKIPNKPRKRYKLEQWVKGVDSARNVAKLILNKEVTMDKLTDKDFKFKYNIPLFKLAKEILPEQIKTLANYDLRLAHYSFYRGEENVNKWVVKNQRGKSGIGGMANEVAFDGINDALSYIKNAVSTFDSNDKPLAKFDVWSELGRPGKFVGKKIATNKFIELARFDTSQEAREHIKLNNAQLVEQLKQKKKIGSYRRAEQNERVGKDYRQNKNISPEEFQDTFGFRGVQFGNWVENDRRQQDLNNAYDGLKDLADVLGVPERALSLNGELGLAFGARGSGGLDSASAHYEPESSVINLTKKSGAGSLAHEWFHALDNYFSKQDDAANPNNHLTDLKRPKRIVKNGKFQLTTGDDFSVRESVYNAFKNIMDVITNETEIVQRSGLLDERKSKDYYRLPTELGARTFERYIIDKLSDKGYESDYLATILSKDAWDSMEVLFGNTKESYPFPTDKEAVKTKAAFDGLFKELKSRKTDKGIELYNLKNNGNEKIRNKFESDVSDVIAGKLDHKTILILSESSSVLEKVGLKKQPITTTGKVIDKIYYDHGLTEKTIKALPDLIEDPEMIFESNTQEGSYVVVLDDKRNDMPLVVALNPDKKLGRFDVTLLASAYYKEGNKSIKGWISSNLLKYQKKRSLGTTNRLQLPYVVHQGSDKILAPNDEKINRSLKKPQIIQFEKLIKTVFETAPISVVMDESDLPGHLKAKIESDGNSGKVKGVFSEGNIYIVGNAHNSISDLTKTVLHETVAHYGLKEMLGDSHAKFIKDVLTAIPHKTRIEVAKRHNLKASNETQIAEEYIAEIAEANSEPSLIQKIISYFKSALRSIQLFESKLNLSDNDIRVALAKSKRFLARRNSTNLSEIQLERQVTGNDGEAVNLRGNAETILRFARKKRESASSLLRCVNG